MEATEVLLPADLGGGAEQVLNMMPDFVADDIRLRKIAGPAHARELGAEGKALLLLLDDASAGVDFVRWGANQEDPYAPDTWSDGAGAPPVMPDGTQMIIRGFDHFEACTFWMK